MVMIKRFKMFEAKDKFPNFKKVEISGFTIIVGKDAKSNDFITFQMADDEDIWLHVKGFFGSHVIIKLSEVQTLKEVKLPTKEVLTTAAQLAKKNSKAKDEELVKVVWCKRKYVFKEPGMKDGQVGVDYLNAEEIII